MQVQMRLKVCDIGLLLILLCIQLAFTRNVAEICDGCLVISNNSKIGFDLVASDLALDIQRLMRFVLVHAVKSRKHLGLVPLHLI